mmetsp:Transcript_12543/g.31738  ORF Transcript_12543/g.31738 Transcript_12543/m.31738 type:complete len:216 (-) Transcript_12543:382-1029(-)
MHRLPKRLPHHLLHHPRLVPSLPLPQLLQHVFGNLVHLVGKVRERHVAEGVHLRGGEDLRPQDLPVRRSLVALFGRLRHALCPPQQPRLNLAVLPQLVVLLHEEVDEVLQRGAVPAGGLLEDGFFQHLGPSSCHLNHGFICQLFQQLDERDGVGRDRLREDLLRGRCVDGIPLLLLSSAGAIVADAGPRTPTVATPVSLLEPLGQRHGEGKVGVE